MFPFWDLVISPLIHAAEARRVLEIGALRGDTTRRMLEDLGPEAELHVIDPVPAFDPSEHEREFPGRYRFHRQLSLDVLPELPPFDVALIDGDHNWYTVYHELKAIAATSEAAGEPLPVLVLHDVAWPYGRRDLYYDPSTIPEQYRQPYKQAGMVKGESALRKRGGLNPTMYNALEEGGPRNGVMTGLDDFVSEHPLPVRQMVIPIYFGLAIAVDEARLERSPAIAEVLDQLETADGLQDLLELAEDTRLRAMVTQHGIFYSAEQRIERAAHRYLNLLKGALVDEHYIENELRIELLLRSLEGLGQPDLVALRDPMRRMKDRAQRALAERRAGRQPVREGALSATYFPYTDRGRLYLDELQERLDVVRRESVAGDLVECGTGRGGTGIFLRGYLSSYEMAGRSVWVASSFLATSPVEGESPTLDDVLPTLRADLNNVRDGFQRFDLFDDQVRFLQGPYADTLPDAGIESIALLVVGEEAVGSLEEILDALYDRVSLGGMVVVADHDPDAVTAYRERRGITEQIERLADTSVCWRKTEHREAVPPAPVTGPRQRAPLAPEVPGVAKDLSVVVVFYNMRREAARTLHSLSRSYQQQIEDLDYEVIVVENGSDPDQVLGEELVRSFGPEFRYVDMGEAATSSPVPALNRGVELSVGRSIALMIDGAHVLSPGVLHFGMVGLTAYRPSIVVTQQWYMGPGQQGDAMDTGYDQDFEDRLFEEINWPADGYRLFDISHFIGERDWLDGLWESNCIFVPRKLLEQVGAFDESFSMPGGGFANLELYERLGASPDVAVTTILGEGSFHQVHGGTSTNMPDPSERHERIASYAHHYQDIRGRAFIGHRKRIHYVGTMFDNAARTRARRRVAPNYFKAGARDPLDGPAETAVPVPQELRAEFTDAFWRSLAWRDVQWLGQRVHRPPTDLFVYQELIHRLRPETVIDVGTGGGGRALFLASICELLGRGHVVSIGKGGHPHRQDHDRITYVEGDPLDEEVLAQVADLVTSAGLVVLGGCRRAKQTSMEFQKYSPYVPVGGYVVIEQTIVNGHPVWPNFGPGPYEAVKGIVESRGEWATDHTLEKYHLTFNPNGYLRRLR